MKVIIASFRVFIRQIIRDDMLLAVCLAPVLAGLFFRFAIPEVEKQLIDYFSLASILTDYYLLFDLLLNLLTPYMFCFASAMVILTEYDERITVYMAITPVGTDGYIMSRLVLPAVISVPATMLATAVFSLTNWSFMLLMTISLLSGLMSLSVTMLIVAISRNRVEGMALAKLSGLLMMGLPIPFFINSQYQYLAVPLPSFWMAKISMNQQYLLTIPAVLTAALWILLFYRWFKHKLSR